MYISMTTVNPGQLCQRLSDREGDSQNSRKWNPDPEFQRDTVWTPKQKKALIDSVKRGYPFGTITVVNFQGEWLIIDGKQRSTTIVSFMNDGFKDDEGQFYSEWNADDKERARQTNIFVHEVELSASEGLCDIVELFRRINTQSKKLTTGELLKSCSAEDTISFMLKVFYNDVEEDEWAERIRGVRTRWQEYFCTGDYNIGTKPPKTRADLTFFSALTISLITGENKTITSSFPLMLENGLKREVTDEMKNKFFQKMEIFLNIVQKGAVSEYFKPTKSGYPKLGEVSVFMYLINIHLSDAVDTNREANNFLIENLLEDFFKLLAENEEKMIRWKVLLRRNRNPENMSYDLGFIRGDNEGDDEGGEYDSPEEE